MPDQHVGDAAELYALGLLDAQERAAIDAHVTTCVACLQRIGEAEATLLALERGTAPVQPPPSLDRRMRFGAARPWMRTWSALAAAFLIGLLPSLWLFADRAQQSQVRSQHDDASLAMLNSHFNHAQFTTRSGTSQPPAKVMYARDRSWIYVVVAGAQRYRVYALEHGIAVPIGTTSGSGATSELFVRTPPPLDALELRDANTIVETARVR